MIQWDDTTELLFNFFFFFFNIVLMVRFVCVRWARMWECVCIWRHLAPALEIFFDSLPFCLRCIFINMFCSALWCRCVALMRNEQLNFLPGLCVAPLMAKGGLTGTRRDVLLGWFSSFVSGLFHSLRLLKNCLLTIEFGPCYFTNQVCQIGAAEQRNAVAKRVLWSWIIS